MNLDCEVLIILVFQIFLKLIYVTFSIGIGNLNNIKLILNRITTEFYSLLKSAFLANPKGTDSLGSLGLTEIFYSLQIIAQLRDNAFNLILDSAII